MAAGCTTLVVAEEAGVADGAYALLKPAGRRRRARWRGSCCAGAGRAR